MQESRKQRTLSCVSQPSKIKFVLEIEPVPQGRPRFSRTTGIVRNPVKSRAFRYQAGLLIKKALREQGITNPLDGALALSAYYVLKKPKSAKNRIHPIVKPDIDNFEKALLDALSGLLYVDDSQICRNIHVKRYVS